MPIHCIGSPLNIALTVSLIACSSENGHHIPVDAEKPLTLAVAAFVEGVMSGSTDLDGLELGLRVVETLTRLC